MRRLAASRVFSLAASRVHAWTSWAASRISWAASRVGILAASRVFILAASRVRILMASGVRISTASRDRILTASRVGMLTVRAAVQPAADGLAAGAADGVGRLRRVPQPGTHPLSLFIFLCLSLSLPFSLFLPPSLPLSPSLFVPPSFSLSISLHTHHHHLPFLSSLPSSIHPSEHFLEASTCGAIIAKRPPVPNEIPRRGQKTRALPLWGQLGISVAALCPCGVYPQHARPKGDACARRFEH